MAEQEPLDSFSLPVPVTLRLCREADLPALEWYGEYTHDREIIRATFEAQERGDMLMLLADLNGFPVGQLWINLALKREERTGCLWAGRVFPWLRSLGLGSRLFALAERLLRERGYAGVEFGVEKDNPDARRLYERLGYRVIGSIPTEWIMRKDL